MEVSNHGIKNNGVNRTGTISCEGVMPSMHGVPDPASAGHHQAMNQTKEKMKWEKTINKIVNECWLRSEPTKRLGNEGWRGELQYLRTLVGVSYCGIMQLKE